MKKVVSIIIGKKTETVPSEPDGIELLYTDEPRTFEEITQVGIKQAKGKYVFIVNGNFTFCDSTGLVSAASAKNADIIVFDGATAFKASVLKSIKPCLNYKLTEICAALNCKSIENCTFKPFSFDTADIQTETYAPLQSYAEELTEILHTFKKCKSKLAKDVYAFVFDGICAQLTKFYMAATLAVRSGELPLETLVKFDTELKQNVVLYLAMDKRFPYGNLNKLRKNKFKISYFTAKKFKKHLND